MNLGDALQTAARQSKDSDQWRETLGRVSKRSEKLALERAAWQNLFKSIDDDRYELRGKLRHESSREVKRNINRQLESRNADWWEAYSKYLRSDAWHDKRRDALNRDNNQCHDCGKLATEVHHESYTSVGDEHVGDLISLCSACHAKRHESKTSRYEDSFPEHPDPIMF